MRLASKWARNIPNRSVDIQTRQLLMKRLNVTEVTKTKILDQTYKK